MRSFSAHKGIEGADSPKTGISYFEPWSKIGVRLAKRAAQAFEPAYLNFRFDPLKCTELVFILYVIDTYSIASLAFS